MEIDKNLPGIFFCFYVFFSYLDGPLEPCLVQGREEELANLAGDPLKNLDKEVLQQIRQAMQKV